MIGYEPWLQRTKKNILKKLKSLSTMTSRPSLLKQAEAKTISFGKPEGPKMSKKEKKESLPGLVEKGKAKQEGETSEPLLAVKLEEKGDLVSTRHTYGYIYRGSRDLGVRKFLFVYSSVSTSQRRRSPLYLSFPSALSTSLCVRFLIINVLAITTSIHETQN